MRSEKHTKPIIRPSTKSCTKRTLKVSGFTLIELLVAITVLAVVAVLGWRGLDSIVRARVGLTSELEQTRGAQLCFAQLENDSAHLAGSNLLGNRETLRAVQQRLVMIRTVYEDNQPTRLQVVAYRLQEGILSRRESIPTRDLEALDGDWQRALTETDNLPAVNLQSNVLAFDLRTWNTDNNAWRVGINAPAATPTEDFTSLLAKPVGVITGLEVSLQLQGRAAPILKLFLLGAA